MTGKAVAGAGEITTKDGKIEKIKDQSGHYKPEAELTHQAVQALKEQGASLRDDEVIVPEHEGLLEGKSAPRVKRRELDAKLRKNYDDLKEYDQNVAAVAAERKKLQDAGQPPDAALEAQAAALEARKAEMEKIRDEMHKYGVGPTNREAKVELGGKGLTEEEFEKVKGDRVKINELLQKKLGITEALPTTIAPAILSDMTQLNVAIFTGMKTVTLPAEAFLQTGGNEKAIRQKQAMKEELLKDLKPEEYDAIKGNREEINKFFAKAGRELLPESTTPDVLNSYPKIKLLFAKAKEKRREEPELEREGSGLGEPELGRESSL